MAKTRWFFPQLALDEWLSNGTVELAGRELLVVAERRRYHLVDAVRVVRVLEGGEDLYGVVGTVRTLAFVTELEAEVLGDSMLIGDAAYEVVGGFVATPQGTFAAHVDAQRRLGFEPSVASEQELIERHLVGALP